MEMGQRADLPMTSPDLPPPPSKRRRVWPWVVLAVLVVWIAIPVIRLAVTYSNQHSDTPSLPVDVEGAPGGRDDLSAHDQSLLVDIAGDVQRFNAAALPLMKSYIDPTVSAQRWARSADRHIQRMRTALNALGADVLTIEDSSLRKTFSDIIGTMTDEVLALEDLEFAVGLVVPSDSSWLGPASGGKRGALRRLQAAAEQRQKLSMELLDRLRPYLDPETLRLILQGAAAQGT